MPIKLTSYFSGQAGSRPVGWSESIFCNTESFSDAATKLIAPANSYLASRCLCLGAGVTNVANKMTKIATGAVPVNPPRRVTVPVPGLIPNKTLAGLPCYGDASKTKLADFSQNVFLLRLTTDPQAEPLYSRSFWLAALPDLGTDITVNRPLAGDWLTAVDNLKLQIINASFCIQVEDRSNANPAKDCTNYDPGTQLYTVVGHGWTNGMKVVAGGFRGTAGAVLPKGVYRIEAVAGDNFKLKGARNMTGNTSLGQFRRLSYAFPLIKGVNERGWTNKKKGRVFGQLVGRRSVSRTSRS